MLYRFGNFCKVAPGTFHTIKFLASFAMMPRAKLLVYTVIDGEFVYDEQVIQFEENLLNAVRVIRYISDFYKFSFITNRYKLTLPLEHLLVKILT